MEKIAVTAQVREKAGKGVARSLRRNKMVPAVLYGLGKSLPISMGSKEMTKILSTEGGEHALISLKLEGAKEGADKMALIKDYQLDPITGGLLHVDLMEIAMDKKVKLPVALHITGASAGVKEGGILQHGLREIEVECLPHQIPGSIEVNVSALKINESLHVRDLQAPEGVKILTESDATVVTIQPPLSDAKLEAMLAVAPPAEGAEPDLVKKLKKEGEAETAEGKPEGKAAGKAEGKAEGKEASKDTKAAAPKK